jgi:hypothetical protein
VEVEAEAITVAVTPISASRRLNPDPAVYETDLFEIESALG